ncbi:hypothetical protein RHMOL_Rhmol02G0287200 [Rhododendron molle]|uniref:Uncharacterized protein n=1 Tax=Rhododendron molle TaxID=49168 RepID=A0ACC0PUX2_RHOML|nr:hypothetical protein RHMOL_Rhmol02G0287200 [Rhododendron molle]
MAIRSSGEEFQRVSTPSMAYARPRKRRRNQGRFDCWRHRGKLNWKMLPEAKGKQCFESLGWLITVSETGDMNLLHPLSRVQIPLPHISFPKTSISLRIRKAALTSCPSPSSKDNYALMVIYEGFRSLCFWKSGDKAWTKIKTSGYFFMDITYYKRKFYSISHEGTLFVCDVWGCDPTVASIVGLILTDIDRPGNHPYIVESEGELLIVVGEGNYYRADYGTKEFRVFKVDLKDLAWAEELHSLGDNALFVGHNSSISVRASNFQGIKPSCIYYTGDYIYNGVSRFLERGRKDTGIYNMKDRSVAPCYKEENLIGKLMLPEVKGKQCFESLGWLITVSETGDMNLLHPLSRFQILLPHISASDFPRTSISLQIQKAVLTSCPSPSLKDNYALMVIYKGYKSLCFWKPGEKAWTTIKTRGYFLTDITYYKGQFYSISLGGTIFVCNVWGRDPTVAKIVGHTFPDITSPSERPYIVESEGELLLVVFDYRTNEFRVFKVDLKDLACAELHSLGSNALFVGHNSSISIRASNFQGIRPKCIYYTGDCLYTGGSQLFKRGGGKGTGIYNMEDRNLAPCYKGGSFSHISSLPVSHG